MISIVTRRLALFKQPTLQQQVGTQRIILDNVRKFCTVQATTGEPVMLEILKKTFPKAEYVEVRDISGGCGAMYEIYIESSEFANLSTVKQHQLVTNALKAQIKDMHGLRIQTKLPGTREGEA